MVLHSERWTLTDDFHQPQHSDPPPRLVCLGTPLATCALPTGVFYLLTYLPHRDLADGREGEHARPQRTRTNTRPTL